MAGRGRNRLPEIRRGQGERRSWSGSTRFRAPASAAPSFRSRSQRSAKAAEASALPTKACGRPAISAISRAGRSRSRRPHRAIRPHRLSARLSRQRAAAAGYGAAPSGPISLAPPGVAPEEDDIDLPPEGTPGAEPAARRARRIRPRRPIRRATALPRLIRRVPMPPARYPQAAPLPRLGPSQGNSVSAFGPVAVKPAATLACPIVSVLDRWLADSVQPAAMRWFGARVVEIKQISAYSCRGMNGNSYAHISEHAFGNALDIAGFTLADGRHISVKDGWKGHAGRAGLSARRAGHRLPAVHHRAGAGLQRLSLRSHPRRSDAPRLAGA